MNVIATRLPVTSPLTELNILFSTFKLSNYDINMRHVCGSAYTVLFEGLAV